MSTNSEIANALRILTKKNFSKKKITLLQCNTDYPTKFEDVNLYSMLKMKKKFKLILDYQIILLGSKRL